MLLFSSYEVQRVLTIEENKTQLRALGLETSPLPKDAGRSAVKKKKIKKTSGNDKIRGTFKFRTSLEEVKSPNTLAAEAEERAERRRLLRPQVRNLFSFEGDEDFENEPEEEQVHSKAPEEELLQVQLNYDDDEVLMHADWRAWQLLFLSHNHVFEYMGS